MDPLNIFSKPSYPLNKNTTRIVRHSIEAQENIERPRGRSQSTGRGRSRSAGATRRHAGAQSTRDSEPAILQALEETEEGDIWNARRDASKFRRTGQRIWSRIFSKTLKHERATDK